MEQRNAWSQQLHVNNLIQLTATSTDRYFLISVSILSYFTKKEMNKDIKNIANSNRKNFQ